MSGPRQPSDEALGRHHAEHRSPAQALRPVPLEAVLSTGELNRRPRRAPDHETENRALATLAQALADAPRSVLQTLADTMLAVFKADSAGISLLSKDEKSFFWPAIAGLWQAQVGGGTPRDFGPCGDVLDCNAPLLFKRPERRYTYLLPVTPVAEECLLLPFHVGGKAVGTLWLIAHDSRRQFDAEDLRQLNSLGRFASAAHQTVQSLDTALEHGQVARSLMEDAVRFGLAMEALHAELREREAFTRSIVNSSPDCIKVLDLDGRLLSMESGQALLGIEDIRPFLNTSWIEFWEPEHRQAAREAVASAAAGKTARFVGLFRTFRGEPKWWDVAVSPITGSDGKRARLLSVSRDVTERTHAEQNLAFLASLSRDLVQWTSVDGLMQTIGAKLAAQLQLSICAFAEIDETAEQAAIQHDWHRQDVPSLVGVYRLADFVGDEFIELARAGDVIVVRDAVTDPRTEPEKIAALKIASFLCVPLIRDGQWRFALCLYKSVAYDWREDEIELTRELTARIWTRLERLRAEAALRLSERRYRNLFESIDEGFCIVEKVVGEAGAPLDFRYIEANLAFELQSGVRDVVGKTIRQLVPGAAEEWVLTYDAVLRTGESIRIERDLLEMGRVRVLEVYAFRVEAQTQACVAVVFKDLTTRKQAEHALRQSEERFRVLVLASSDVVYRMSPDWSEMLQLHGQNFIADTAAPNDNWLAEYIHPDDQPRVMAVINEAIRTKGLFELEHQVRLVDGSLGWTFSHAIPLLDAAGEIVEWFGTASDVTEQKRAESALRESEDRYRSLFNSMDQGYCIIEMIFDANGKPVDYLYLEVNPSFETMSGMHSAQGKRIRELVPDLEEFWFDFYGKVALTGEAVRVVNEAKPLNRWFDVYAFRLGGPDSRKVAVLFTNITDRTKAEEALRQSEERFRALFDWGPIAMYSCNSAGVIQDYNRGAVKLWKREPRPGETDEQFRGSFKTYLPDGSFLPYAQTFMTRTLKGQAPAAHDLEVDIERPDGSRISLVVNVVPLKNERGDISGAITCFYDITERKRAEAAQRASEEQFRATFEHAAIGIVHVGLDNRWLRVNPAMCRLTGYSADELTGHAFADITHPDDVAGNQDQARRLRAGEMASFTTEKRYVHKSGRHVWVTLTASLLRDANGVPQYIIAAIEDISEKKLALAELDRQQRFIERLTHIMPNTLHVFSLAERRNLWVNRHVGTTLGYSAEQIAAMGPGFARLVLHPDDVAPMAAHLDSVVAASDNEVLEFEYRLRDHAGEWRWLRHSDTVFRRDAEGRALELVGTATDVTDRKRIAVDLSAALVAAEQANRAKSDFLSSMSHELRSPLNTVLGFAQLIESGTPAPTPQQRESVDEILKAGWYLLELINEILDLTLIESGRLSMALEPVSLAEVLSDCQAMIELQARHNGIRLSFAPLDDACMVCVDRTRVKQIFINLLSNAIKYNRPGGSVRVSCAAQDENRIRIRVEDTGAGLTPDQIDRLFQPFERLGRETGLIEGTGIGLVVSKRLVELMGGAIGAQSSVGQGSVFWVDLATTGALRPAPAAPAAHSAHTAPGAPAVIRPGQAPVPGTALSTVLCVEDNPANMMLMQRILARRTDLRLLLTGEGSHGLEVARATRPDVVLMDINLPGISGLELMKMLAGDAATAHIPVIAISANALRHDVENGLRAGFFRFLTKPIKIELFMEALDAALKLASARPTPTASKAETS